MVKRAKAAGLPFEEAGSSPPKLFCGPEQENMHASDLLRSSLQRGIAGLASHSSPSGSTAYVWMIQARVPHPTSALHLEVLEGWSPVDENSFFEELKTGLVLCKVVERPNFGPEPHPPTSKKQKSKTRASKGWLYMTLHTMLSTIGYLIKVLSVSVSLGAATGHVNVQAL